MSSIKYEIKTEKDIIDKLCTNFPKLKEFSFGDLANYLIKTISLYEDITNNTNVNIINNEPIISVIDDNFKNQKNDFTILSKELVTLNEKLNKFTNRSTNIGQLGENIVEDILNNEFKDKEIVRTTTKLHSGDFIINNELLIEVKLYNKNVPSSEIDKFKYDITFNKCKLGILYGINCGICNHKRLDIENCKEYNILYVPFANRDAIVWSILVAQLITKEIIKINEGPNIIKSYYNEWIAIYNNHVEMEQIIYNNLLNTQNMYSKYCSFGAIFRNLLDRITLEIKNCK